MAGRELSRDARLVYVRAPGCSVCVERHPVAERIAAAAGLPLDVLDLSDDADRARAEALRIQRIPTLALHLGERVPFRLVGSMITAENVEHLMRSTME